MTVTDLYRNRLQQHQAQVAHLDRLDNRIATLRMVVFAIALAMVWLIFSPEMLSRLWLSLPVLGFAVLAICHSRVRRVRLREDRIVSFYRSGVARIEDRWQGNGVHGERFNDPHHPYAADLDLFGPGSLFELLFTGRTRMGEDALAQWLLAPAPVTTIRQRHGCVAELSERLDLREQLAILGEDAGVGVHPQALRQWAEMQNVLTQRWLPWMAVVLPALVVVGAIIWSIWGVASPLVLVLLIEFALTKALLPQLQRILYAAEQAFEDIRLLAALLQRIEREPFRAPRLQALQQKLLSHSRTASQAIASLATIVQLIESRRNPILQVLAIPLLYFVQVALAAERWRRTHGKAVGPWLDVIGEMEALLSLAAYSQEHPGDPFPELVEGTATFRAEALGHPLIPAARCVHNCVAIEGVTRVLLISGSNMSGKSTLLRAVGINTVLAMAGAPVRASALSLTPLQVGASIRINDSLHEGSSRFYAEITRLRQLNELSEHSPALLFLLDEMLQGTNSRDRRIGADGVVRAFIEAGAIGLISTHDLALTDIVAAGEQLRNCHFQDELKDGRMRFDFKLRDGVVTRSNGIELMRSIGLKV